jgi:transposase
MACSPSGSTTGLSVWSAKRSRPSWCRCGYNNRRWRQPAGIAQSVRVDDAYRSARRTGVAGGLVVWPAMNLLACSVWLATEPVDMRTGIDGLSLRVQQVLGRLPCDGTAYVFSNRRRTRLKLVCWDGTGVWMCLRRLHRGQFIWPQPGEQCWQLSAAQWQWLVAGVDWQRLSAPAPAQWRL